MTDERIILLIVIAIVVGILYYRFTVGDIWLNQLSERLSNLWKMYNPFLTSRGRFILGGILIAIFQYNLSSLESVPYYLVGRFVYSDTSAPEFSSSQFGFPEPILTILNYFMLLVGCLLLASSLKFFDAIPREKEITLFGGDPFRFFKGRPVVTLIAGLILLGYLLWQLYNQSTQDYLIGLWLMAIIILGYFVTRLDIKNDVFLGPHLRRTDFVWLTGLFLLGLVVGLYRLQGLPNQFLGDEGSFWALASDTAMGLAHPLFFDNGVFSFPNASSIWQAFVLMIFGVSVWSWRFSALLAGLLTIFPLYMLGRELFGRQVAVVSCILMVTLEYFLAFSHLGYISSQSLFPVVLALYFIVVAVKRNSLLYFYLAGCAIGLGFYTFTAARSALVIVALFMLTLLLQNRVRKQNSFKAILILGLGWAVFASPLLVFSGVHSPGSGTLKLGESIFFNTNFSTPLYPRERIVSAPGTVLFGEDGAYFYNPQIYVQLIARGFIRTLLSFNIAAGLIYEHYITQPLAGLVGAAFFTLGMVISLLRFRQRSHYLLLFWFLTNVILLSTLNTFPPRHQHLVSIIPLIALWTALGLVSTVNGFIRIFPRAATLRVALVAALTLGVAAAGLYGYFVKMPDQYRPNAEQIISWAALKAKDEKIIYVYDTLETSIPNIFTKQFIRPNFPYTTVPLSGLTTQLGGNDKTIVLFASRIDSEVTSILKSHWSEISAQRTFFYIEDIIVLEGAANFQTDFGAAPDPLLDLRDSYLPALWLILLVIAFLVFAISFRPAWIQAAPSWFKQVYHWVTCESP